MAWLNEERIRVYSRIFLVLYILIYGYFIFAGNGMLDVNGKPIGSDFVQYWAASKIILSGNPIDVYDLHKLFSMEKSITGINYFLPMHYPPTFLLAIVPLAFLPYIPSLIVWLGSTFFIFLIVVRQIAPHTATLWLTIAFSGTFQNFIHGQNGFLSTAILGGGLLCMKRCPFLGGVVLGFLTYKPHLAILIPVALIAGRYWKTLAGMIFSTLTFILISALVFGIEIWFQFIQKIPFAFNMLEKSAFPLYQMTTTLAAALLSGFDIQIARLLHGTVAVIAVTVMIWIWFQKSPFFLRASSLVLAILLFTPHANTYDLTLLSLPLAWIGWKLHFEKHLPNNMIILPICWISPLLCVPIALVTKIQIIPFILGIFLFLVLRMNRKYYSRSESF